MILSKELQKLFDSDDYLAHIPEDNTKNVKKSETLKEHSLLCMKYFDKINLMKDIRGKVYKILSACGCKENDQAYIWDMFRNAIFLHDIGKINPVFQYKRMKNVLFKEKSNILDRESDHALLSAYIYLNEYMKDFSAADEISRSPYLFSFAYCISRHHSYLKNTINFTENLKKWVDNTVYSQNLKLNKPIFSQTNRLFKKEIKNEAAFFILARLLFSLITACDFYATSEYKSGFEVELNCSLPFHDIRNKYYSSGLYQSIQAYRNQNRHKNTNNLNINQLRNEIFLEAEETLLNNIDKNIFYLEAPTGSGKTNTSINLFLKLVLSVPDIKNVFYIFPFNTLVEQTKNVLMSYVQADDLCVMNSLTPIIKREDESYENAYLNYIAMNYPIMVTSHVNLFSTLFGTTREQVFSLYQLCNSIIILDEIQSYRIGIWSEFILFLSNYAELLNIKVIIMSATLPPLDMLLERNVDVVRLIKCPEDYFKNPHFRERVKLDFSMANRKYGLEEIANTVLKYKGHKVLIEFFKKSTARKFYKIISAMDHGETEVVELTGDDNIESRASTLMKIANAERIIVVATQVIEAGIDIDMDIGFKDISLPDSDEQFLGRINRSCKKSGSIAFFFHHDNAESIYSTKGQFDFRLKYSIDNMEYAELFRTKDFSKIYELVLNDIKNFRIQKNAFNIEAVYNNCRNLNFQNIEETMKLMESNYQIFLGYLLVRENGEIVDGNALWEEYKQLCTNTELPYAEKMIKLSQLYSKMALFTYNIILSEDAEWGCGEKYGGYIYISNGEEFLEDGKFDRQKLVEYSRRLIL